MVKLYEDCRVNQRLNLAEQKRLNLAERYSEFKSIKKEVKERQIYKTTDYDPDEFALLFTLISADNYENILNL